MKIGVVGCGAVGSYYGGMLARAGHEVHFLLRSDFEIVRSKGVQVLSPAGDFAFTPGVARDPREIGVCDLVLIGLKTTANGEFPSLLPPLVGPGTLLLTLQNGLGNEERLARTFPMTQILGGLCFVCIHRLEPGVIQHLAHGRVVLGELERRSAAGAESLARSFCESGVSCSVTEDLAQAHWEKLIWNIPFNGLGVAAVAGFESVCRGRWAAGQPLHPCLPTDQLLEDPRWERLVRALMQEVIAAANGLGLPVNAALEEHHIQSTRAMGAYRASTLIDFERGRPLEHEALFLEPQRRAGRAGVRMPRLEALCEVLAALDGARAPTSPG